jgi:hypothetical protein
VGRDAGGFDAIAACRKIVLSEMHLSLDDGELIAEMTQSVVLSMVAFDFSSGVPVVKVGNGTTESMVGRGGAIE